MQAGQTAGPIDLSPQAIPAELRVVARQLLEATQRGTLPALPTWCSHKTLRSLAKQGKLEQPPFSAADLAGWLDRAPDRVVRNGNVVIFEHSAATPPHALYWYLEQGAWRLDPLYRPPYVEPQPGDATTENHPISLQEATAGVPGEGDLYVTMATTRGEIRCRLFEAEAPQTVANFVGLARGLRAFKDGTRSDQPAAGIWRRKPFFDGLTFHRVIPGFVIQGGDPEGTGEGGPGYTFADEFAPQVRYLPGSLGMANGGPNTNGSQFFVTLGPTDWLNDRYNLFGHCDDLRVAVDIAAQPTLTAEPSRPVDPVRIQTLRFERRPGPAEAGTRQ